MISIDNNKDSFTVDVSKLSQPEFDSLIKRYKKKGYSLVDTHNDYWDTAVLYGIVTFEK